jgi:hypothetical protein
MPSQAVLGGLVLAALPRKERVSAMPSSALVAVPCKLAPGMLSSERLFSVEMADGKVHCGIAPRYFCWNDKGQLVAESEPSQEENGKIAARVVGEFNGFVTVEVPDGEVIAVPRGAVRERPTEIVPPGRVGPVPTEPNPNVPVRP